MIGVVLASDLAFFLTGEGAQQDAARRNHPSIAKSLGELEHTGRSGSVVVGARPDLSVEFAVVIVVRTDDDDFAPQLGIAAFNDPDDVLGCKGNTLDVDASEKRASEDRETAADSVSSIRPWISRSCGIQAGGPPVPTSERQEFSDSAGPPCLPSGASFLG